ncbi:MAG: hypothetical protein LUH05_06280 [Candidatus Gastranaerophilales bacterium]|nr:hypothetical protein [Candidatus Gastranaerophilales bacterium]
MNISLNKIPDIFFNSACNKGQKNQLYPNLAPLDKDTVSFSGSRKLSGSHMASAPSNILCTRVEENAEPARYYLELVFDKYIKPLKDEPSNPKKNSPIIGYSTRIKSSNSIREKVATKFAEEENSDYNPSSINGIKHYSNDIVGGRILLNNANPANMSSIIEAFKLAVKEGVLKITSIENYFPKEEMIPDGKYSTEYEYASHEQLKSLAKAANAEFINVPSKAGYLAVHINVDLSDPVFNKCNKSFNDYNGEIQIICKSVEKLKDIEDLCYKIKDDKIPNKAYKPFKDYFLKYYNKDTKDAFNEYTYKLYLYQRLNPGSTNFPSIKQLGFEGRVPPELDYNILKKLKYSCDLQEGILNKSGNGSKPSIELIKRKGDIDTMKKIIAFKLDV